MHRPHSFTTLLKFCFKKAYTIFFIYVFLCSCNKVYNANSIGLTVHFTSSHVSMLYSIHINHVNSIFNCHNLFSLFSVASYGDT